MNDPRESLWKHNGGGKRTSLQVHCSTVVLMTDVDSRNTSRMFDGCYFEFERDQTFKQRRKNREETSSSLISLLYQRKVKTHPHGEVNTVTQNPRHVSSTERENLQMEFFFPKDSEN